MGTGPGGQPPPPTQAPRARSWWGLRWWARRLGGLRLERPAGGPEALLVISDVHLGEDILARDLPHMSQYIRVLNHRLAEFLAYHREHAPAGQRWHLVINGDMFDFVKVSVAATPQQIRDAAGRSLANTADHVVRKLEAILGVHRPLFRQLGRFVAAGHRLTLIEGNHDAEVFFSEVRERLRTHLIDLGGVQAAQARATMAERIQFSSWFLAEPGRYHIEHGHQYDEYCSFEYNLAPLGDAEARVLATPLSHRPMPYFAELLGDFSTHDVHLWSWRRTLAFLWQLGPRTSLTLAWLYLKVGMMLLWQARATGRQVRHLWRAEHERALGALARGDTLGPSKAYPLAVLLALDRLKAAPAEIRLRKIVHLFGFDRVFLLGCAALTLAVVGAVWGARAGFVGAMVLVLAALGLSLGRRADTGEVLRRAAARVADITGAPVVIFGHSHLPEAIDLRQHYQVGRFGQRPTYLNSGSWVTREILRGEQGRGMTYVQMVGIQPQLLRWHGAEHGGRPVTAGAA